MGVRGQIILEKSAVCTINRTGHIGKVCQVADVVRVLSVKIKCVVYGTEVQHLLADFVPEIAVPEVTYLELADRLLILLKDHRDLDGTDNSRDLHIAQCRRISVLDTEKISEAFLDRFSKCLRFFRNSDCSDRR